MGLKNAASVVVNDLYLTHPALEPDEAHPPLVVDTDAMLPSSVPLQGLQPVARGRPQVLQPGGGARFMA